MTTPRPSTVTKPTPYTRKLTQKQPREEPQSTRASKAFKALTSTFRNSSSSQSTSFGPVYSQPVSHQPSAFTSLSAPLQPDSRQVSPLPSGPSQTEPQLSGPPLSRPTAAIPLQQSFTETTAQEQFPHGNRARERAEAWDRQKLTDEYVKNYTRRLNTQEENQLLRQQVRALQQQESELQRKLSNQDYDVRQAQESAFALLSSNAPSAEDDDIVRSRLKSIRGQWKVFAKDWALKDVRDTNSEHNVTLSQHIQRILMPENLQAKDGIMAKTNRGKAYVILFNMELARFIGEEILGRPFISAFEYNAEVPGETKSPNSTLGALEHLYNNYLEVDEPAAHTWRSDTVKLLDPLRSKPSTANEEARNRRERYYQKLVEDFMSSDRVYLLQPCGPPEREKRSARLLEIFRSTGEFACKLWSQKVNITLVGAEKLVQKPFSMDDNLFEAHATHTSRLDADPKSMDGMPIQLVVEPGILAWGTERGEAYQSYKVWLKAVVWMTTEARESDKRTPRMVIGEQ